MPLSMFRNIISLIEYIVTFNGPDSRKKALIQCVFMQCRYLYLLVTQTKSTSRNSTASIHVFRCYCTKAPVNIECLSTVVGRDY